MFAVLGEERAAQLAQLHKQDGSPVGPGDLSITVNYWGGAKGRWMPRPFASDEESLPEWGERTGEFIHIRTGVFRQCPRGRLEIRTRWLPGSQEMARVSAG